MKVFHPKGNNAKRAISKFTFSAFPCLNEEQKSFCLFQNQKMAPLIQAQCPFLETQS